MCPVINDVWNLMNLLYIFSRFSDHASWCLLCGSESYVKIMMYMFFLLNHKWGSYAVSQKWYSKCVIRL